MLNCKGCDTPMVTEQKLQKEVKGYLGQFVEDTIGYKSFVGGGREMRITSFTDVDWACDIDDRKSIGAYCIYFGNNLVSWSSKKQSVVTSAESEYRALASASAEIAWIQSLLSELNIKCTSIPTIWCDNMSATKLAKNPVYQSRTKHIELDMHFVKDKRRVLERAKELINEAIADKLDLKLLKIDTSSTFRVADLGCSTGPNTFIAMQNIIEAIELKLFQASHKNPATVEFQVFFNDHPENNFNTLFKTLPHSRKYFAAGVPGFFQDRLFPNSTLHIVHSSFALHWISKIPEEIAGGKSLAWNKESIQGKRFVKEVAEAYSTQFKKDIESFLNARAQELVAGGLMSQTTFGIFFDVFGSCLMDMAKMVRI
ncbi:putative S-adenosylmethionine-dependent methyltransferase [Citrus sinensis]|uniref:S-adenosylmethionine-dependent methyltransferase n=1 Tax=Citrus sinensis TaxID=2711 RepID=A0ACB8KAS4_CITSI|nr:putative S-adenosylmethionine-dependent methyltransferase [Citrus sinensis]